MQTREPEELLSTPELLRHAVAEAKLLARAELVHAKLELQDEIHKAKTGGIALGAAAVLALCGLAMALVALALLLPLPHAAAIGIGAFVLLTAAAIAALIGIRRLPKEPMKRTRSRLLEDVKLTREQLA